MTLNEKRGSNIKYTAHAFTEQGIAMLSSVLRSDRAIQVNIQIVRAFTQMRKMLASHAELREKIEELEQTTDGNFKVIFRAIEQIMDELEKGKNNDADPEQEPKGRLGFDPNQNDT